MTDGRDLKTNKRRKDAILIKMIYRSYRVHVYTSGVRMSHMKYFLEQRQKGGLI